MKAELHIPTEQYGFVAITLEDFDPESVRETYNTYKAAFQAKAGLEKKAFDAFIDRYLQGEKNHVEDYEKMNDEQKMVVQVIKRSLARIKSRSQREEEVSAKDRDE